MGRILGARWFGIELWLNRALLLRSACNKEESFELIVFWIEPEEYSMSLLTALYRAILVAVFLFSASLATAQPFHWEAMGAPAYDGVTSMAVTTNGDIIAGNGLIFFISSDGIGWKRFPMPHMYGKVKQLLALPNGKLVVLTEKNILFRMDRDGSNPVVLRRDLLKIVSDRRGVMYSVPSKSYITRSTNSGDSWDSIPGPQNEWLVAISADAQKYYLTTLSGIYTSADSGMSWKRCLNAPHMTAYESIVVGESGVVWAFAFTGNFSAVVRSTDFGVNWSSMSVGVQGMTDCPLYSGSNEEMIANISSRVLYCNLTASNFVDVSGWTGAICFDSTGRWLYGVKADSAGVNIVSCAHARPDTLKPFASLPLSALPNMVRAFGTIMHGTDTNQYLLNPSQHWSRIKWAKGSLIGMDQSNNTVLAIYGSNLLRSSDTGKSWKTITPSLPVGDIFVAAVPPSEIFLASNGVYVTKNSGITWDETQDNSLPWPVKGLASDSIGNLFATFDTQMYIGALGGNTWKLVPYTFRRPMVNLQTNRAGTIALTQGYNTILRSFDQGLSWESTPLPDWSGIASEVLLPSGDIMAASSSGVYFWQKGKSSPVSISDGLDSLGVLSVSYDANGTFYAATDGAGVFKGVGDLSLLSGVARPQPSTNATLSPNPATSFVRIALPSEGGWKASAFDELGRERVLQSFESVGELRCDVSALRPGAYQIVAFSNADRVIGRVQVVR